MDRIPRRRTPLLAALLVLALAVGLTGCGGSGHARSGSTGTASTQGAATGTASTQGAGTGTASTQGAGASASAAVTYGIGDAPGQYASCAPNDPDCCAPQAARCDIAHMEGYFDSPLFLRLLAPASSHRVSDVRLFVPYDAVQQWNGSRSAPGCTYSRVREHPWYDAANGWTQAGAAIDDLMAGVIEARAEGLTPVVTISGYPFTGARPAWDPRFPDPTTTAGYWAYRCGLQGILDELSRLPAWARPHTWEAVNEPEAFPIFTGSTAAPANGCAIGATPQPNGPAKAACTEAIASRVIHGFADHLADTVIAGTLKIPDVSYLASYVAELARQMPGARFPSTWSVHDYREVTTGYTGAGAPQLAAFDAALARDTGGRARSLWISEAAPRLDSPVRSGDCAAVGVDAAGSLGACINGQPARQKASAEAFFALPHAADAVPITHLFWYQFIGAPGWDSGLLAPDGGPRPAYCVFYGSGQCTGSPNAA